MKNMKKCLSIALAGVMALSMVGCGDSDSSKDTSEAKESSLTNGGKVFRIYCWNDEIQNRFKYVEDVMPDDVKVEWVVNINEGGVYQQKLDAALKKQETASADDKIDMFLFEADYALKYVNSDYTVDVKDIGITDEDIKDQYQYTKDIATDKSGALKGLTWQATPGLFAYRRSIAKDVLGTDDPNKVQEALADWDKFDEVAEKASSKGYKMLSGYDDSYRVFSNNVKAPWVNENNEIIVDDNIKNWVKQTKTYTDKKYNNKTILWDTAWQADQGPKGKVFGFFYSTWGINFTLMGNALDKALPKGVSATGTPEEFEKLTKNNGAFGDYAVCTGPASYYWGGSWVAGCKGSDNKDELCAVMKKLSCDKEIAEKITKDTEDYTNNSVAMEEIANDSSYGSLFLGGQNHIKLFADAAPKIDASNISPYDQGCNEEIQTAFHDYFNGKVDEATAYDNFYKAVIKKYPELKKPADA